jgi:hypothetical protein
MAALNRKCMNTTTGIAKQSVLQRWLTLDNVYLFAALAILALRPLLTTIPMHDFWWHLAMGREIVTTGAIPIVDTFSFTRAGEPFFNQSWLAQLLMYWLYSLGGPQLLIAVQALVIVATYGLLLHLCIARTARLRLCVALLMIGTMPASFTNWVIRPQSYALPLFAIFLYVLTAWRLGPGSGLWREFQLGSWRISALWMLPLLATLWVNIHGSFVLGGGLIFLTFIGEWLRRFIGDRQEERAWAKRPIGRAEDVIERVAQPKLPPLWEILLCGGLVGCAWLLNPRGLAVIGYVRNLLGSSQVTELVTEWAAPTIRDISGALFFVFVIGGVLILAYARRAPDLVDMLLFVVFFWLALGAIRNNVWFALVATPLFAVQAASWRDDDEAAHRSSTGSPLLNGLLIGVLAFVLLMASPWIKPALALPPQIGALIDPTTPVAALEQLRSDELRPQRLFHDLGYGSYLIWAAPEQPVFIDPRIELYPYAQWQDFLQLSRGENVAALLKRYNIDGLLLDQLYQKEMIDWARKAEGWELHYEDDVAAYFVRH